MFGDFSLLVTLYKIDDLSFHLIGTNDFHVKERNERFTACRHNLKLKIAPDRLADYENEMNLNASCTCSRNISLLLTIHIIYLFMALSLTNPSSFLKLTFK